MSSTLTNLVYHVVFSTKKRQKLITQDVSQQLYPYIGGIIRAEKGKLFKIGGISDHIHLLARFHPSISVSDMLRRIKGNSSKWLNEKQLIAAKFGWQTGYAAFSVSESACEAVAKYIENQLQHHKKMSFKEEYLLILKKHQVEYNEKYIWD